MINSTNKSNLTYISLFSGAGIGCYGFKLENFYCISTVEILEKRLKIQKANQKCLFASGYICGDIRNEDVKNKIKNNLNIFNKKFNKKDLDVLIATPPCQGMSVANHKKQNEKGRNSLVVESIKLVIDLAPKFFIFENVRSFLSTVCTDIDGSDKSIKEAIEVNLEGRYNILYRVVNFKNYGSDSSRTRTIVLGIRKDQKNITPFDIFPNLQKEKTLFQVIGDLPELKEMGQISNNDIYHQFKEYSPRMRDWISGISEGESAFDRKETTPYRIINGQIVYNKNKNSDKYKRQFFNRVAPCIHTRNDILASQNTVHPRDDRVFSIRELMRMMTIPDSFRWSDNESNLNALSYQEKKKFLKKNEMTIRHSIGEGVPTTIFNQIAKKIKNQSNKKYLSEKELKNFIIKNNLASTDVLKEFIEKNPFNLDYNTLLNIVEIANAKRIEHSAYYTRQDVCYSIVKNLPDSKKYSRLRILEPSVGAGSFLPLLIRKYEDVENVIIDVVDIDLNSIHLLKLLLKKINIPKNIKINFIVNDFLMQNFDEHYDIVIGNPPFGKVNDKELLNTYRLGAINNKTNNIFAFFIEKSIKLGDLVALIVPKMLLSAPAFEQTRKVLEGYAFQNIIDYGETGFKGVKIETISFIASINKKKISDVKIESYITKSSVIKKQKYIFDKDFPYWLIYRNDFFDKIKDKLTLGIFNSFRDRQITKKHTKSSGSIRVLKSRNITQNGIRNLSNYDCYIDMENNFSVAKFLNNENVVLVPNLTYNPRACFLPKNAIADGSVALLNIKNPQIKITNKDLDYFSTDEFSKFYSIARNLGTRSLNIDNHSVFYFGVLKKI